MPGDVTEIDTPSTPPSERAEEGEAGGVGRRIDAPLVALGGAALSRAAPGGSGGGGRRQDRARGPGGLGFRRRL